MVPGGARRPLVGTKARGERRNRGPARRGPALEHPARAEPGAVLFNRLWPLAVFTVLSGVVGFFVPQVPVVATGFCLFVALLLRRESSAVAAIEGRDGVEFWFDKSSPFGAPKLLRLPGLRRIEPA